MQDCAQGATQEGAPACLPARCLCPNAWLGNSPPPQMLCFFSGRTWRQAREPLGKSPPDRGDLRVNLLSSGGIRPSMLRIPVNRKSSFFCSDLQRFWAFSAAQSLYNPGFCTQTEKRRPQTPLCSRARKGVEGDGPASFAQILSACARLPRSALPASMLASMLGSWHPPIPENARQEKTG